MENAADALKMAAAVLIFVIALSTAMFGFTKARQAASAVMSKSDNTRYYDSNNIDVLDSRIVGIETVIPTLYSYFKEGYTVLFYKGSIDDKGNLNGSITPMTLYYTEALPNNLTNSRLRVSERSDERRIYGLDSDDESVRREPWASDDVTYKNFIMALIDRKQSPQYDFSRAKFSNSPNSTYGNSNKLRINFQYNFDGSNTALSSLTVAKFLERQGIYNANRVKTGDINDINTIIDVDDSRIEFEGDVSVENGTGIQKRVIQYIYLTN